MGDNAAGESFDVVAALQGADQPAWREPVSNITGKPGEIFTAEGEPAEGVFGMGIEAGADEGKVGVEVFENPVKIATEELPVGSGFEASLQWAIQGGSLAGSLAFFLGSPRSRVKRRLVERIEKNRGVGIEDVLCSIAVVDIPVDDGHPGDSALALQITGGYRDIVEKTKPHDLIEFGVVARRPAATEGIFGARGEYCIDCR